MSNVFLFAGEDSGDIHGEFLLELLKAKGPLHKYWGVGGKRMRASGLDTLLHTESFMVMGFQDVLFQLPSLMKKFYKIKNAILDKKPAALILIDYPEFNLALARSLRKKGYRGKIIQMICPTVWAWRKSRIKTLERYFDLLLTIYPFEKKLFDERKLKVEYIGNPIANKVKDHQYKVHWNLNFDINLTKPLLSLFPGSREKEVTFNLNKQLEGAFHLAKNFKDLQVAVSIARPNLLGPMKLAAKKSPLKKNLAFIPQELTYELMQASTAAIAKCGTVTLELALHGCPSIVTYETSNLNRFIAKYLLRLKLEQFSMTNILAEKTVFPEFIKTPKDPMEYAKTLHSFFVAGPKRKWVMDECEKVKQMLTLDNAKEHIWQALAPFVAL